VEKAGKLLQHNGMDLDRWIAWKISVLFEEGEGLKAAARCVGW